MIKQDKNIKQEFLRRFKYIGEIMWLYMKEASVEHYEVEIGDIQVVLDEGYNEVFIDTDEGNHQSFQGVKVEDECLWIGFIENGYMMDLPAMYVSSESLKRIYKYLKQYFDKLKEEYE